MKEPLGDSVNIFESGFIPLYLFACFEKNVCFSKYLIKYLYGHQNNLLMGHLLFPSSKDPHKKKTNPENDFRKKIQKIEKTKNLFYNPKKNLNKSSSEILHSPIISLTFSEDSSTLTRVLQTNLKNSILFEYKICQNLQRCLDEDSPEVSDSFFLEMGNVFSYYLHSMLQFEFFSISELSSLLSTLNQYLRVFLERFTDIHQDNCFDIIKTILHLFHNFSHFLDLK
jgi:hypothetical protein